MTQFVRLITWPTARKLPLLALASWLTVGVGCGSEDHSDASEAKESAPKKAVGGAHSGGNGSSSNSTASVGGSGGVNGSSLVESTPQSAGGTLGVEQSTGGSAGETAPSSTAQFVGVAQKGPYTRGASVVVSELDESLRQTGRAFTCEIEDNSGKFKLNLGTWVDRYVKLSASGFYFNEVLGDLSTAPLSLIALAKTAGSAETNVNVLTQLETPRVEYLIEHGTSFDDAKNQAQREVLGTFLIKLNQSDDSEKLDISQDGEADTALLAASVMLQGYLSVAELTELLSVIASDLREDGKLDDADAGTALKNAATLVDPALVRKHLEERYATLGIASKIGAFEAHIENFRKNAPYPVMSRAFIPETKGKLPNILSEENDGTELFVGKCCETNRVALAISGPANQPLSVRITPLDQTEVSSLNPAFLPENFTPTSRNPLVYDVTEPGRESYNVFSLMYNGAARIEVLEGAAQAVTVTRNVRWTNGMGGNGMGSLPSTSGGSSAGTSSSAPSGNQGMGGTNSSGS